MPNTVSVFKVLNLNLQTYEGHCANLPSNARTNKAKELVLNLEKKTTGFTSQNKLRKAATIACSPVANNS
jgi:hypothetical protein